MMASNDSRCFHVVVSHMCTSVELLPVIHYYLQYVYMYAVLCLHMFNIVYLLLTVVFYSLSHSPFYVL
jgi:hypothetical protein